MIKEKDDSGMSFTGPAGSRGSDTEYGVNLSPDMGESKNPFSKRKTDVEFGNLGSNQWKTQASVKDTVQSSHPKGSSNFEMGNDYQDNRNRSNSMAQNFYNGTNLTASSEKSNQNFEFGNLGSQTAQSAGTRQTSGYYWDQTSFKGIGEQKNNNYELGDLDNRGSLQTEYSRELTDKNSNGNRPVDEFKEKDKYEV